MSSAETGPKQAELTWLSSGGWLGPAWCVCFALSALLGSDASGAELIWRGLPEEGLVRTGAVDLSRVVLGREWWRLATGPWLHASVLHLVLNVWSWEALRRWDALDGSRGLAWWWFAGGVGGALGSILALEGPVSVGASGGLFACFCLGAVRRLAREGWRATRDWGMLCGLGLLVGGAWLARFIPIAHYAHVGGAALGALVGVTERRFRWGIAGGAVLVAGIGAGVERLPRSPEPWFHDGIRRLAAETDGCGLEALDRAAALGMRGPALDNARAYARGICGVELTLAQRLVQRALEVDGSSSDYLDTAGWVACRRGQPEEGLRYLASALAVRPDDAVIKQHQRKCRDSFHVEP